MLVCKYTQQLRLGNTMEVKGMRSLMKTLKNRGIERFLMNKGGG